MSALSKVRGVNIRKDDSRRLEDEAHKMEAKIEMLRKVMAEGNSDRTSAGDSGGRWRSGTAKKPLRSGYVKDVLDSKSGRASSGKRADVTRLRPAAGSDGGSQVGSARGGSRGASGRTTPTQAEAPQGTFASALAADVAPPAPAGRGAAANLQAALADQSREALEVEAFLAGLGLDRYVSLFVEHGFDCMEVVEEMEESHMRDIGMATGHILKLRKRLTELRPTPPPAPAPAPAATQSGASAASTQKRVSFGGAEAAAVRSPGGGMGTGTDGGGSLWGDFDEEAEKASFQEAVRAWREGREPDSGPPAQAQPPPPAEAPKLAPGAFWSSFGGEAELNLERCSTPVAAPTSGETLQSEAQHDPAPSEEKLCCYQCYKQFYAKYAVERCSPLPDGGMKRLCSTACADLWTASMQAKAEELQQRQEKLAKLAEVQRAMEYELKASAGDLGAEQVAVAA